MADKALVMGINKYKSVTPLRGCENDVRNIHDLVVKEFGFSARNVRTLTNKEVVKKSVAQQMKWLFEGAKDGDRVVFHFSGHGSYTADADGDDDRGTDELICLWDMDFSNKNSFFIDDELREWTKRKPKGVQLLVILDNCHSGTGTRMLAAPSGTRTLHSEAGEVLVIEKATERRARDRGLTRSLHALAEDNAQQLVLARFVEPPEHIRRLRKKHGSRSLARSLGASTMNHVLLAACKDTQTAADAFIDSTYQGAFSNALCRVLRAEGVDIDRAQLLKKIRAMLQGEYDQIPQLEAASEFGPLFGSKAREEDNNVELIEPNGHTESDSGIQSETALLREILASLKAIDRKLDAGRAAPLTASRATGRKALVYVHGIGTPEAGYSQDWWESMEPHVPSLAPGTPDDIRYEVFWGDIVNRSLSAMVSRDPDVESTSEAADKLDALRELLEITLEERTKAETPPAAAARSLGGEVLGRGFFDGLQNFLGLPQIDDFLRYLTFDSVRKSCIGRFTDVVRPLLEDGRSIDIISHSWGTVVAYEGLRELEADSLPGEVRNFFTVGAALSMSLVKNRLRSENRDGARPNMVRLWSNLDAQGDPVGGSLRVVGFRVDNEWLDLAPVGCTRGRFGGYGVSCAHSSYFVADNLKTNRDIFGEFIEG